MADNILDDTLDEDDGGAEEFAWETRDKAIEELKDLLPTMAEVEKETEWWSKKPDSQLLADESQVIALLKCKGPYGGNTIAPFLIAERMFMASCSSSWSSGLHRYPNCQLNWHDIHDTAPSGQCDPFEEWEISDLHRGLELAHKRIETGRPQPAGEFGFIIIDLYAAYGGGWQLTGEFWDRLALFRKMTSDCHLNQNGYEIVRQHDDHAVMILPPEANKYDQYLLKSLQELHEKVGICLGFSQGLLYYLNEREIFSEAINRLWLEMKNLPSGGAFRDSAGGHRLAKRIGLSGNL